MKIWIEESGSDGDSSLRYWNWDILRSKPQIFLTLRMGAMHVAPLYMNENEFVLTCMNVRKLIDFAEDAGDSYMATEGGDNPGWSRLTRSYWRILTACQIGDDHEIFQSIDRLGLILQSDGSSVKGRGVDLIRQFGGLYKAILYREVDLSDEWWSKSRPSSIVQRDLIRACKDGGCIPDDLLLKIEDAIGSGPHNTMNNKVGWEERFHLAMGLLKWKYSISRPSYWQSVRFLRFGESGLRLSA
ncbi:MAG: hypothetical protein H6827_10825 [Planctomycetes bacterium]|nr:hypothetical protein [Planctomycetota bacterium]